LEKKRVSATKILCECAIMLALSIALSYVIIYEAPMGGSVTLVSMLPVMFVGVKHGYKWGLGTSLLFAAFQLIQSIIKGNVFVYCTNASMVIICVLFDYILPFGILGLTAIACTRGRGFNRFKILTVFAVLIAVRFVCHYITGVFIWGQWAEGMSTYLYSLIYNGTYMLPELVITVAVAWVLTLYKPVRVLLCQEA
jgi:thiamine transporter